MRGYTRPPGMRRFPTGRCSWLVLVCLLAVWGLASGPAPWVHAREGGTSPWLFFARRVGGQDDLWALSPDGERLLRLTATPDDERWPALSPDGRRLAYAARRNRNWDIYVLDLTTGQEERLTQDPHFDGWPAWSPDGQRLAFASMRAGDLDIFVLDLRRRALQNMTADSPAHDFDPDWSPDGRAIAFVSTRAGVHDIFLAELDSGAVGPLVSGPQSFRRPRWLPDGRLALLVRAGRRADVALADARTGRWKRLQGVGVASDAAPSPDGRLLRWVEPRENRAFIVEGETAGTDRLPRRVAGPFPEPTRDLKWGLADEQLLIQQAERVASLSSPPVAGAGGRQEEEPLLVRLEDWHTGIPRLNSLVAPSFEALRERVRAEVGYDFLAEVSEALRPVDFASEGSDYLSWHKAGRAVDILLDAGFDHDGYPRLEIVREDRFDEVFWRVWLRCAAQDGSCGRPLTEPPWDLSYRARWVEAPGQGGKPRGFVPGYYVDFTQLAEDAGWRRISSYESPDFDWRTDKTALEFWHYQRTDDLTWWQAMQQVHPADELARWFDWPLVQEQEESLWRLEAKGLPIPPAHRATAVRLVMP